MKAIKLIIGSLVLIAIGNHAVEAQTSQKFTINGSIRNIEPMPPYLYWSLNGKTIDSSVVTNGKYTYSGTVTTPTLYNLAAKPKPGSVTLDNVGVIVTGGVMEIVSDGGLGKSIKSGQGAAADMEYYRAIANTIHLADSLKKVIAESFNKPPEQRPNLSMMLGEAATSMDRDAQAYLNLHPNSAAAYPLMEIVITSLSAQHTSTENIEALLQKLSPTVQNGLKNKYSTVLADRKAKEHAKAANDEKALVGQQAVDFIENDQNGKPINLASFRGKYVLIDFWASWCAPCRAENPNVLAAYNKYKEKGFTVLGVSLDGASQKAAWITAIEKDGMPWTQVSDLKGFGNKAAEMYGVTAIPQNFLIDPNGKIVAKSLRGEDLQSTLAKIFK